MLAAACGGGTGTRADLISVLARDGAFTEGQATCVADEVFAEYGDNDDVLGTLSAAESFDVIESPEDGVPGFGEFFTAAVQGCVTAGPTP